MAGFAMLLFFSYCRGEAQEDFIQRLEWVSAPEDVAKERVELTAPEFFAQEDPAPGELSKILRVYAIQGTALDLIDLPPMLGAYSVFDDRIRFQPRFPLSSEVTYRAIATLKDGSVLTAELRKNRDKSGPLTRVEAVYPTAVALPENLLKFYVVFSQPMRRGDSYAHLSLLDGESREIPLPFLEIDEELWSRDMKRLTLLIDPGRIKRGVRPLEEIGPALLEGRRMRLVISPEWKDARGRILQDEFVKEFEVVAPERRPIRVEDWTLEAPPAGTTKPILVKFDRPMDFALSQRMIGVADQNGREILCESILEAGETRLSLRPLSRWGSGVYDLWVVTTLEDLCGNNVGKPFEVDVAETGGRRIEARTVKREFSIVGR